MNSPRKPFRVLFVCMGNICRSPAAEIIFRKQIHDANLTELVETDSAGTTDFHRGSPPDSRMAETLRRAGYEIAGRARGIKHEDLDRFDLIVTMDEENLADVRRLDKSRQFHEKIRPMVSYCKHHEDARVPDPYYGGQRGFDHVLRLLEDACSGLVREIGHRMACA